MFTGLVEGMATVDQVCEEPPGRRLVLRAPDSYDQTAVGDSIALNGCCLTAIEVRGNLLSFEAGPETLERTNLGELVAGRRLNVERSLCVGDRLGGHFVTGHVDQVGTLEKRHDEGEWSTLYFRMPRQLSVQMASKGSVAVDGVSLTLVDVEPEHFSVALIPHTLEMTTLGRLATGDRVNLETDLLAKYVQQQFQDR